MTAFFVTGTDTGCGKTYVTSLLVKYFQSLSIDCLALKPIASGCEWQKDRWFNEDVELLMAANQSNLVINQWLFEPPVSPHFAAAKIGVELNADDVISFCRQPQFLNHQLQLIEGAGGLMVPLNARETWVDLLSKAQIPLIAVVGIRLGCINHSSLMNEVIKMHQLPVAGWVANVVDGQTDLLEENINDIRSRLNFPMLGRVDNNAQSIIPTPELEKIYTHVAHN